MRRVLQRCDSDCGVACLAMVTGKRYEEIFTRLGFEDDDSEFFTKHSDLVYVLTACGRSVKWRKFKGWSVIEGVAIVAVNHSQDRKYFHWVVFDGRKILDPQPSPYMRYIASGWYLKIEM